MRRLEKRGLIRAVRDFRGWRKFAPSEVARLRELLAGVSSMKTSAAEDLNANELRVAALSYAARGWPVVPLHSLQSGRCTCRKTDCKHLGKHPRTHHGVKDATTDESIVHRWWQQWPDANIGIATGRASGIVALDVDPRHGGDDTLAKLERQHGPITDTIRALTGGGGVHSLFAYPSTPVKSRNGVAPGIDVKADGGYIVAAPSRHQSGREYAWDAAFHPEETPLALPPAWLLSLLQNGNGAGKRRSKPIDDVITLGKRRPQLVSLAGSMRRRGMTENEILAALKEVNKNRCRPPLADPKVERIARGVAKYPPADGEDDRAFTELGNAQLLVDLHSEDLIYCPGLGWHVFDGGRWRQDDTGEVMRRAQDVVLHLLRRSADLTNQAVDKIEKATADGLMSEKVQEECNKLSTKAGQFLRWAYATQSRRRLEAIEALARLDERIVHRADDLDTNPWLLNCLNGTLYLRTGELRPHCREDLLTKLAPVEYDAEARSELFDQFLERAIPDPGARRFAQKAAGYTLAGVTGEDVLLLVHGPTRSGKGTFQDALAAALGEYAKTAELELLAERDRADGSQPRPELVRLRGARMVSIYEQSKRLRLSASLTKTVTGTDPITARDLYKPPITFRPQFTLWIATNYRPKAPEDDDAFWERLRELPFPTSIPEQERDPTVRAVLRDPVRSGPAVLAWAAQGCLMWQAEGLGKPEAVRKATQEYREEMDPLRQFVADCCVVDPSAWTLTAGLRTEYEEWAKENGEKPISGDLFRRALRRRGCTPERRHAGRGWLGIGLLDQHEGVTGDGA